MKRVLIKAGHFTRDNGHSNSPNDLDANALIKDVLVELGFLTKTRVNGCCVYAINVDNLQTVLEIV